MADDTDEDEESEREAFLDIAKTMQIAMQECFGRGHGVAAVSVVTVQVASDYMRYAFGDSILDDLAEVVRQRANDPLPDVQLLS